MTSFNHLLPVLSDPEMLELYMLRDYAQRCHRVTEFGVHDCTSTWWLLAGLAEIPPGSGGPARLTSYDIGITSKPWPGHPGAIESEVEKVAQAAKESGIDYRFVLGDTLKVEIEETDFLFIDSCHTYRHLKQELALHSGKVRKYLGFHDTSVFAERDEAGVPPGIWPAIEEFLAANPQWHLKDRLTNFNGITVLEHL